MEKARLEKFYTDHLRDQLQKEFGLNVMNVPKINKIVLNVGVKEAVTDSKLLTSVQNNLTKIAGQKAVKTIARKSIAGFKLREGMAIGAMVTLRKRRMYEYLDRLITLGLPKVRDFQGLSTKCDGRGGYNLGIKDCGIFPEISFNVDEKLYGLNVTIQTSAKNRSSAKNNELTLALLKGFGLPFRKA
jgi:large subunit ribosomal protein L5